MKYLEMFQLLMASDVDISGQLSKVPVQNDSAVSSFLTFPERQYHRCATAKMALIVKGPTLERISSRRANSSKS